MPNVLIAMSRLHCMDGIASNIATLMPALRRHGWEPHFAVGYIDCPPGYEAQLDAIRGAAASFHHDPLLSFTGRLSPIQVVKQAAAMRRLTDLTEGSIIHLRGRALGPAATLNRATGGCAAVNVPPLAPDPKRASLRSLLNPFAGRLFGARVIAISTEMIDHIIGTWGVPKARVRHVPHGVPLERFRPPTVEEVAAARERLGLPCDAFVVLQLARVGPVKRPDTVVRALARLVQEGRTAAVAFAGHCGPAERDEILKLADGLGVRDKVYLLGQTDSQTAIWAADAKVLASEREGFGISVIEAMACGLPVLRTPVEGASDQIEDGVSGLLFPVGDDRALSIHLSRLIVDPQYARSLGDAARLRAIDRFSDDAMARGTIAVYEELC